MKSVASSILLGRQKASLKATLTCAFRCIYLTNTILQLGALVQVAYPLGVIQK